MKAQSYNLLTPSRSISEMEKMRETYLKRIEAINKKILAHENLSDPYIAPERRVREIRELKRNVESLQAGVDGHTIRIEGLKKIINNAPITPSEHTALMRLTVFSSDPLISGYSNIEEVSQAEHSPSLDM